MKNVKDASAIELRVERRKLDEKAQQPDGLTARQQARVEAIESELDRRTRP